MNTGQMLMVVGAMSLLGTITLSINKMIVDKTLLMLEAEATINSVSVAQAMIDEIQRKDFDQNTTGGVKVYSASSMTSPSALGPETGETFTLPDTSTPFLSITKYNDVDDYNRYSRKASTPRLSGFTVTDSVYYVDENNPDNLSSTQTFVKKIVVTVTHPNMTNPLKLSDVAIYRRYF